MQFNGIQQGDDQDRNMFRNGGGTIASTRLLYTLLGLAPGANAAQTKKQVKWEQGSPGGLITIETINIVNRATNAADLTAFQALISRVVQPSVSSRSQWKWWWWQADCREWGCILMARGDYTPEIKTSMGTGKPGRVNVTPRKPSPAGADSPQKLHVIPKQASRRILLLTSSKMRCRRPPCPPGMPPMMHGGTFRMWLPQRVLHMRS